MNPTYYKRGDHLSTLDSVLAAFESLALLKNRAQLQLRHTKTVIVRAWARSL
jgi:hypothetical protein